MLKHGVKNNSGYRMDEVQMIAANKRFNEDYAGSGLSRRNFFIKHADRPMYCYVHGAMETPRWIDTSGDIYQACYWGIGHHTFLFVPKYNELDWGETVRFVPHELSLKQFIKLQQRRIADCGLVGKPEIENLYLVDVEFVSFYESEKINPKHRTLEL